ncbi:MAG: hypothetical protein ACHQEB_05640, partial [Chitinophagales bacterium]
MKSKLYPIILSSVITVLFGCKTASKLYEKGNYDEAVDVAAKKLQKDPTDKKLLDIIQSSYRFAVQDHESKISNYSSSTNELKWEWIYNEYSSLQNMYEAIRKSPSVYDLIKPTDYSSYLITYAEKAGDTRFERGQQLMQKNDKLSYRNAYHEFQAALRFKPGDLNIQDKMNQAYDYAVTNVVVLPLDQSGFQFGSYNRNYSYNNLDDQLLRNLKYNAGNEFVKYYSSAEATSHNIRTDQVIDMRFADLNIGRYREEKTTRDVTKEVVTKEIVYRKDSVVKVYGKVSARITTTRRTMQSFGVLQATIRDGNGGWVWSNNFRGDHNWTTELVTYSGDERALSDSDKQLIDRKQEQAPRDEDIIRTITDEINSKLW